MSLKVFCKGKCLHSEIIKVKENTKINESCQNNHTSKLEASVQENDHTVFQKSNANFHEFIMQVPFFFLPPARVDKFTSGASSVYRVVATDNWLLKVTNYQVQLIHLRDAVLSLEGSHTTHGPAPATPTPSQLLTIKVVPVREGVPAFSIRCGDIFLIYVIYETHLSQLCFPFHFLAWPYSFLEDRQGEGLKTPSDGWIQFFVT